jgi:hypothetical protein
LFLPSTMAAMNEFGMFPADAHAFCIFDGCLSPGNLIQPGDTVVYLGAKEVVYHALCAMTEVFLQTEWILTSRQSSTRVAPSLSSTSSCDYVSTVVPFPFRPARCEREDVIS